MILFRNSQSTCVRVCVHVCMHVHMYTHTYTQFCINIFILPYSPLKAKDEILSCLVRLSLCYLSFNLVMVLAFVNADRILGSYIKPTCIAWISGFMSRLPQKQLFQKSALEQQRKSDAPGNIT